MTAEPAPWVEALVAGSAGGPARAGLDATVALAVGSADPVVLDIGDGRILGPSGSEAQVVIPLTDEQFESLAAGTWSLATAYMRGDVKPVGSSGALLVAVEVLEDRRSWSTLAG